MHRKQTHTCRSLKKTNFAINWRINCTLCTSSIRSPFKSAKNKTSSGVILANFSDAHIGQIVLVWIEFQLNMDATETALPSKLRANFYNKAETDYTSDESSALLGGHVTVVSGNKHVPREPTSGKTSTFGAIFIVVNACIGAGLLNFPAAYQAAGGIAVGTSMQLVSLFFLSVGLYVLLSDCLFVEAQHLSVSVIYCVLVCVSSCLFVCCLSVVCLLFCLSVVSVSGWLIVCLHVGLSVCPSHV